MLQTVKPELEEDSSLDIFHKSVKCSYSIDCIICQGIVTMILWVNWICVRKPQMF